MRQRRKEEKVVGGWLLGLGAARPKIRQEMRKENEKKSLPKL